VLQGTVAGEQHQALAVGIEAARGIDTGHLHVVLQRAATGFVGELAQHAERLVEQQEACLSSSFGRSVGFFYTR